MADNPDISDTTGSEANAGLPRPPLSYTAPEVIASATQVRRTEPGWVQRNLRVISVGLLGLIVGLGIGGLLFGMFGSSEQSFDSDFIRRNLIGMLLSACSMIFCWWFFSSFRAERRLEKSSRKSLGTHRPPDQELTGGGCVSLLFFPSLAMFLLCSAALLSELFGWSWLL